MVHLRFGFVLLCFVKTPVTFSTNQKKLKPAIARSSLPALGTIYIRFLLYRIVA